MASRFNREVPLFTERPFLLSIDGHVVNGRIDAIFGGPDGGWEVVDYKTGRQPGRRRADPAGRVRVGVCRCGASAART